MTDWQPWPPPADGELIEVEVPGDDSRYFGFVVEGNGIRRMEVAAYRRWSNGPQMCKSGLRYVEVPPSARWRRV